MQQLERRGFTQIGWIAVGATVALTCVSARAKQTWFCRHENRSGFTLIELMITIAVFSILVMIAVPSYTHFISSNRAHKTMDAFVGSLVYARNAASKHGQSVTVCASIDGSSCSGVGPWGGGWLVFLDVNSDGMFDANNDQAFRVHGALASGDTLTGNGNITDTITLNRFGRPNSIGTVTLVTDEGVRRCVILSITGKLRLASAGGCEP